MEERYIEIPMERYDELITAEHEAKALKRYISTKAAEFYTVSANELNYLKILFCGEESEGDEE